MQKLEDCIKNGANVDERDSNGWTALLHAEWEKHKSAVEFLIAHKANVNYQSNGYCALIEAARWGREEICEMLLKAGADTNLTWQGRTAVQAANRNGHHELADFIDSCGKVCCVCVRKQTEKRKRKQTSKHTSDCKRCQSMM